MTAADWQAPFDLNLVPTVHFTRAAARQMMAAGHGGAVVNLASTTGLSAAPNLARVRRGEGCDTCRGT